MKRTISAILTISEGKSIGNAGSGILSNPNASAQAQSLYSFLCDTYGNYVISGQQESTWMGSVDYEMNIIRNASGKLPVLRGLDYMGDDFSGVNNRAKDWYQKGGIVEICWHCGSDFSGSHTESLETNLNWERALTPGTNEYNDLAVLKRTLLQKDAAPSVTPAEYMDSVRNAVSERLPAGADAVTNGVDYGTMQTYSYYSTTRERDTNVNVLLPAGYNENEEYPVLCIPDSCPRVSLSLTRKRANRGSCC